MISGAKSLCVCARLCISETLLFLHQRPTTPHTLESRMGVKLLALLAFSPLFLAKACIDLISSLNQYFLDYLPGPCPIARASSAPVTQPFMN